MKKLLKIILFAATISFFAGCNNAKLNSPTMSKPKLSRPIAANGVASMHHDTARVILAISAKILKSKKNTTGVIFQQPYKSKLIDASIFSFKNAILLSEQKSMKNKQITADLFFKDSIGRSVIYNITASYKKQGGEVLVSKLNIKDKFTELTDTVCFILPAKKILKLEENGIPRNFYTLYRFAAINAVTPEQALKYKGKSDWAIMVFALNRVPESGVMTLGISDDKNDYNKVDASNTKYINYKGWRVAIVAGKFYLLEPNNTKKLYAKVVFKPWKNNYDGIGSKEPKIIALYRIR